MAAGGWDLGGLFGLGDLATGTGSQWGNMFDGMSDSLFGSDAVPGMMSGVDSMQGQNPAFQLGKDFGLDESMSYAQNNSLFDVGNAYGGDVAGSAGSFAPAVPANSGWLSNSWDGATGKQGTNLFNMGTQGFKAYQGYQNQQKLNDYMDDTNDRAKQSMAMQQTQFDDNQTRDARARALKY